MLSGIVFPSRTSRKNQRNAAFCQREGLYTFGLRVQKANLQTEDLEPAGVRGRGYSHTQSHSLLSAVHRTQRRGLPKEASGHKAKKSGSTDPGQWSKPKWQKPALTGLKQFP